MKYSDITDELFAKWQQNKKINPLTGEKMNKNNNIYMMLEVYENKFMNNILEDEEQTIWEGFEHADEEEIDWMLYK